MSEIYTELQIVLLICLIGITFGVGWQIGKVLTQALIDKFSKPVIVRFTDDGTVSKVKLSHKEARGYQKVSSLWKESDLREHD